MSLLPFASLPPHKPRLFVPAITDLGDWSLLAPLYAALERRLSATGTTGTGAELERWLMDWSELAAAVDEEATRRYIAMTCHTDDPQAEKAYLHFIEKIEPQVKECQFKLSRLYIGHPCRGQLDPDRYKVFDRNTRVEVELFRPENVALETEEARLSQQYQKLAGSLTVTFRGQEKTLVEMARYLEEPDRGLRQEAWELVAKRRLQEAEKFEDIYDRLVKVRGEIARNAGYCNYRDYAFRKLCRFDYTPADCERFHDAVETEIMPVVRELQASRRRQLNLGSLRPWDLSVDPLNRPPLRPFADAGELVIRTQRIFDKLDPGLAGGFRLMQELHLLDLANRKGKAPGGYQSTLAEARLPFIFMNAVGLQRDVETILHEAGHAFHALATREEDLMAYRNPPIEFCEVASMSMELLGNQFIEEFYSAPEASRARRANLEGIVGIFAWIATVDAFQHWVYTHTGHSRQERADAWTGLMKRFGGDVDWAGFEPACEMLWHKQLHIFVHAFYYIEYGIAQLGALQVWANSKRDAALALNQYKEALKLGGSRSLPQLFGTAGCKFDLGRDTIAPLGRLVREELLKLPN